MNKIHIAGLRARTLIGTHAYERTFKQPVELNLTLFVDTDKPSHSDCLDDAVDYAKITHQVTMLVEQAEFQLLEKLAHNIVETLLSTYPLLHGVQLQLKKFPRDMNAEHVTLEYTVTRHT